MDEIFQAASGILSSIKMKQGSDACSVLGPISHASNEHLALTGACMIEYLIVSRAAIIFWTSLAVVPANVLFDAIENELERRGVEL
jgi:hypothetical protein